METERNVFGKNLSRSVAERNSAFLIETYLGL